MISLFAFLSVVYSAFYIRSGKTQFACIVHNKDQRLINTIVTCSLHDRGTRLSNKKPGMNSDAVSAPHAAPVLVPQTKAWFMRSPPWHDRYGISVSQMTMDMFVGCPICTFSFSHCVVCSSSIYEFWLPLLVSSNSSSTYRTDFPVLAWNGNHFVLRNGDNSDKKIYIQVGNWQMVYCNIYRIYRFVISNIIYGSNILSSWRVLKYL